MLNTVEVQNPGITIKKFFRVTVSWHKANVQSKCITHDIAEAGRLLMWYMQ